MVPEKDDFPIQIASRTDPGRKRKINEDAFSFHVPENPDDLSSEGLFCVVADGMGGHDAGEVASRTAVEEAVRSFLNHSSPNLRERLKESVAAANTAIGKVAQSIDSPAGMGTTLVAAAIRGNQVCVANVGDSRAYLIRGGEIQQITTDHSWVQEQIDAGKLSKEDVHTHPRRNLITRAMGLYPRIEIDLFTKTIEDGDILVLCSDGLWGQVKDEEIARYATEKPIDEAVQGLVDLANERGGPDNITVILLRVLKTPGEPSGEEWKQSTERILEQTQPLAGNLEPSPAGIPHLAAAAGVFLAALLFLLVYYLFSR